MRQIYLYSLATLTVRQIVWQIVRLMMGAALQVRMQECRGAAEMQRHKTTKPQSCTAYLGTFMPSMTSNEMLWPPNATSNTPKPV